MQHVKMIVTVMTEGKMKHDIFGISFSLFPILLSFVVNYKFSSLPSPTVARQIMDACLMTLCGVYKVIK